MARNTSGTPAGEKRTGVPKLTRRSSQRDAALTEAKNRERAAGKKISRNEAQGKNIARSQFDPRVGAKALDNMSTRELRAHTAKVNRFVSRETQFVKGFAGSPLPKDLWQKYKDLEAKNNARARQILDKIGNIKLPGQDLTIAGRISMTTPVQGAGNQGRIVQPITRRPEDVNGVEGLQKLTEAMREKARGDYLKRTARARLNSGEAILKYSGNEDLISVVEGLTLEQQQILVDHSTFFDIALDQFDSPDKSEVSQIQDAFYEEHEGVGKNIHVREALLEQLEWVREITRGDSTTGTNSRGTRRPSGRTDRGRP